MMRLALLVCTVCGVGYSPIAPGTAGSAAGLVCYALFRWLGLSPLAEGLVIVAIFIVAAIVTPPDVVSQIALALPMCLLYEVGIVLAQIITRRKAAAAGVAAETRE